MHDYLGTRGEWRAIPITFARELHCATPSGNIDCGRYAADARCAPEWGPVCGAALSLLLSELEQRRDQLLYQLARAMRPQWLHQQSLVHRTEARAFLSGGTQAP